MEIIFATAGQFSKASWVKNFIRAEFSIQYKTFFFNHLALDILVIYLTNF